MSVATWSLRERAVCSLPPTGPTISVSRRSIAMWMSSSSASNAERAVVELGLDALEPAEQRVAVGVADDPGRGEHRRVRARLLDVVGPEPPVEADRGVELAEDGMLGLREARHTGIMPAMEVVVRPARPDDPARRAALSSRPRPYYAAYAGGAGARAAAAAPRSTRAPAHTASWEVCHVAEAGGAVVGVLAAFPARDGDALARRFVRAHAAALAAVADPAR